MLSFLSGSYHSDLANRVSAMEENVHGNPGGLPARVQAIEDWHSNPESYPGTPLQENYNTVSTLLGVLVGAVNTTNARVNSIQEKLISKGILAAS